MAIDDLGGRRLGGFELIEELGSGSFGSVWRARQIRLDRDVAVKVLDPIVARDPTAARRFEREGRAAASLEHPAIVPVYEAGDDDGLYYLAMRLVDGQTFADVIDREAPLSRDRVLNVLRPIADALDTAHAAGIIHRDVKPANILIEDDRPYLTDFGIAASARELGRYTTGSLGTAEYMAPEQARGDELDHRADLYALGCVAFHALTGASPFERDDVVATLVAHSNDPIPTTGDADLDAFFARALAKDPDERFDSGAELVAALAGETVPPATGTSTAASGGERNPRRPLLIALAALVAVTVVAVGVVALTGGDSDEGASATTDGAAVTADPTADANAETTDTPTTVTAAGTGATTSPETTGETGGSDATTTTAEPVAIRDGGNVTVGTTLDLDDPNPHSNLDASRVLSEWVLPVMYRVDADLDPVPSLAIGPPEPDPDDPLQLTWTIHGDRTWDDGTPVTAADVVATFEYLTADDTNARNILLYEPVVAVDAVDDTTLRITLSEPHGAAYLMFSTIHPIIQADAWRAHLAGGGTAGDFLDDGVTFAAGPYRLISRQNPGELALGPNPVWSGEPQPALDRVEFASYPDPASLVEARSLSEVDVIWVDDIRRDELRDAEELDDTVTQVGSSTVAVQVTINTQRTPLDDQRVRQAILHAIDRAAIADVAVGPKIDAIPGTWDSLVFAPAQRGNEQPFADTFDPAEAERLLDEAGWTRPEDGAFRRRDGEELVLDLVLIGEADLTNTGVAIVNDLRNVGIEVRGLSGTVDQTNERLATGDFDLLLQFRLFNSDPVAAEVSFATDGCPATVPGCSGQGVNVGGFSDADVDAAFADADIETDPDQRLGVFTSIDERLAELVPAVPLYVRPAFAAYDQTLVGIEVAPNIGPLTSLSHWAFH